MTGGVVLRLADRSTNIVPSYVYLFPPDSSSNNLCLTSPCTAGVVLQARTLSEASW